ncbi:MAG: methyltransferase domain-containing protein [Pirellulales bacterium]|nr:methyltransferase domain-containing protein [Pirellulales bacterium]
MGRGDRPQWQLPPGVPRGVWEYAQAEEIALDYDEHFRGSQLFQLDEQVLGEYFCRPGLVIDLGCGTGRALVPLARRAMRCVGVDLSRPMLGVLGRKQAEENLPILRIQVNLVELDCIRDEAADYCMCLFSTLGMVRGRGNRDRVLGHAQRILKPGGLFVVHVHNTWNRIFDAAGRRWLAGNLLQSLLKRDVELGDRFFDERGAAKLFVHTFSRRELTVGLRRAGFDLLRLIPLAAASQRPLRWPWLLGRLRATGWIAVCRKRPPVKKPTTPAILN